MKALVSGYSEVNFQPNDISQTSTPEVMQPSLSKLTSLKNATYWKFVSGSEVSTSKGQKQICAILRTVLLILCFVKS